ncbi:MAG: type II toxin-antitoxin system VapB family antitoxin [Deltaproteobacteria bacterium]|nr:type II toxin-antitoxin system VapB family antitoxin [Deltaproteobacteria bacterium]
MRTNIEVDDNLMTSAINITGIKTKKGVVEYALKEVIDLHKRRALLKLKGKIKWSGDLDEMRKV